MRYNINTRDDFASGYMTKAHGGASMAKSIPLSQGKFAIVDDGDFEYLNQFKWHYDNTGYASRTLSRVLIFRLSRHISMHREITEAPVGMEVDHINGNRLDNRRSNLRVCTKAENRRNIGVRKNNSTGYKGVCYRKYIKQWQAQITVNSKAVYLGYYKTAEEAAKVYDQAAVKYYGNFANINIKENK
jgi:hypothetical protein